jgi:3-hydroxyacyl-[acyl-carrier-protein] dehydratase
MAQHEYVLTEVKQTGDGTFQAQARVGADSIWFDGHFPGVPVLPGIAQLSMVADLIQRMIPSHINPAGLQRIRFKQPVRPDDLLALTVTAKDDNQFVFHIALNGETACRGTMIMAEMKRVPPNER